MLSIENDFTVGESEAREIREEKIRYVKIAYIAKRTYPRCEHFTCIQIDM